MIRNPFYPHICSCRPAGCGAACTLADYPFPLEFRNDPLTSETSVGDQPRPRILLSQTAARKRKLELDKIDDHFTLEVV
jgi:hypothetical protein